MAAEFTLPLTAEGSVTAPSTSTLFTFVEPSAESVLFQDVGPASVLEIPEFGWAVADGVNPLRLITKGNVYNAGGVAPNTAMTLAISGAAKASVVGTYTGQPNDLEAMYIGRSGVDSGTIRFKNTLSAPYALGYEVKIGASDDATYTNLQKMINGTGTEGTDYWYPHDLPSWAEMIPISVSALDTVAGTITFQYTEYGTVGNSASSVEFPTVTNFSFASTTLTGGTNGTGTSPSSGTYRYFYTWFRSADGAETGRSPIATITTSGNWNIAISALTASADTTFDFIRIYRTETLGVEFFLLGAVPRATSTFTDDISDTTLAASPPWQEVLFREYAEGMPPRGRALALWKGRMWSLGALLAADYTKGTVSVTEGNATATFSVKGVSPLMVGRTFQVDATSETYTILSVSETGPTAVLDRVYEGTTNGTATFKIMDDYDASAIRASVQFLWNQWPTSESPGRVDTDDPAGGTALLATKSRLFAFSRTSIVAVTGDGPESWEISKISDRVGCVGPRLVVGIGDGCVFLSHDDVYALSPDETLTSLSSPKARKKELAQGIAGTLERINWATVDQGYALYDGVEGEIVFGLPLDGALVPNYEVVYNLQNSTWTTFKRAEWTDLATAALPDGTPIKIAGDREGNVWHVEVGESDGFYGAEAVATLTGAQTVRTLTASGASWSTSGDGEKGKPVVVLYADGVTVAYGKVAANTGTTLTLAEDLATAPAASDQVVLGGIAWQAKSGFSTLGEEYDTKTVRSVTVRHAPTTRGEYFLSFAVNGGSYALPPVGTGVGTLSDTDGKTRHFVQWPGDTHSFNLRGFKPGGRATLRGGVIDLFVREKARM